MIEQTLTTYIPHDRRLAIIRGVPLPEADIGAALFADISGFTPLTEALASALGPRQGIEELTHQINGVYDALIAEVERYGGSVISFSGDAITCWFSETFKHVSVEAAAAAADLNASATPDRSGAALRAVSCALALQRAMGALASVPIPGGGMVALALKVAVASGPVRRFAVGDPANQLFDALAGATVARTATGEHLTQKGEVVIDAPTAELLGDAAHVSEWRADEASGEEYGVVASLRRAAPEAPWPQATLDSEQARAWLLPAVYERLSDGLGEFLTELRPAVALFLRFGGIDYDDDHGAGARLDRFIRQAQAVLARYGGTLLQLTIGDKGSYLYAAFGAPSAHEDDARRAASAALELQAALADGGSVGQIQIGISQGIMRSGAYGASTRRTYAVLGDEVNLAARLMQLAAAGETLVSGRVLERISAAFVHEVLPPVRLKGKREPTPLARLLRAEALGAAPISYAGALVGRGAELEQIQRMLRPLARGTFAGLIWVHGEPGMGKSRLVAELRRALTAPQGRRALRSSWLSFPADEILHQSLHPFRTLLRSYFDQNPNIESAERRARFDAALDDLITSLARTNRRGARAQADTRVAQRAQLAAELERTRSFLAALVDVRWDGSLYEQVDPKLRFENTVGALKALFLAEALRRPLVIHFEDAQWLDQDSHAVIQTLTRNIANYPLAVLLTSRYQDDGSPISLAVAEGTPQGAIELRALGPEGVRAVAAQMLGAPIGDHLAAFLSEKTGGNPFFVEQLALDLRERGALGADPGWSGQLAAPLTLLTSSSEVPDSLNAVLIARLDRLAARVRAVVQTAAVLGQEFEVRLLSGMLRNEVMLSDTVQLAEQEAIWTALNELRYLFRHALLRDAAYDMQLRSRLRDLHRLAGETIEQIYAADLAPRAADLAYHYGRAEDAARERQYARVAGEHAAARYANADAAAFFSRALELTAAEDRAARYELLLAREQVYDLQGAREAQRADLTALAELAEQLGDPQRSVEVALRLARHADVTSDYPAMIVAAQRAILIAQAATNAAGEASGHLHWARALWYQGDYPGAQAQATQALELARAAAAPRLEAECLRMIGNVAIDQGAYLDSRRAYLDALDIHRALDDRRNESATRSNLGIVSWYQGDYEAARAAYEYDLQIKRELGDRYGQSLALLNLGEVAVVQGDLPGALAYYEQALRLKRETDDRYGESVVLTNLGDMATALGDWGQARASYDAALGITQALGHRQQQGWALARLGLLLHQQGAEADSRAHATQAITLAREINDRNTLAYALTLHGHVLGALGQAAEARAAYQEALDLRIALAQPILAAETRAGLIDLALANGDTGAALHDTEAILGLLVGGVLDGADEPFRVSLICYRALRGAGDGRADALLSAAHSRLEERALKIESPQARRTFRERVPSHRDLIAAWRSATAAPE